MAVRWEERDGPTTIAGAGAVPLEQHALYAAAQARAGQPMRHFALPGAGGARGAAQVLIRRWPLLGRFAILVAGPVWAPDLPDGERRAALLALLARLRSEHAGVMATPDPIAGVDPLEGGRWLTVITPATTLRLDLAPDEAALRAGLAGKWRNRLVRAESAGLRVTDAAFPDAPEHWLLRAEAGQRRARRYAGLPLDFTRAWISETGRHGTRLFTAHADGRPVAAMLFLLHPPGASYHIGWSGEAGRAADAHRLLMWRAMLWLRHNGHAALDFDVIDTETAPGLARFKLGTGARPVGHGATRLAAPGTRLVAALLQARRAG